VKTEEKSVVSGNVPRRTKDIEANKFINPIVLTWCPECKQMAPYRWENRGDVWCFICEWCGGNMGDVYLTRMFYKAPEGTIVVRDEERIS
jgi:hypothetical protein